MDADTIFPAARYPVVPIVGETRGYAVHRVFCVGRNYVDHVDEMGGEVDREAPLFFIKPADAVVLSGATIPYPPETRDLHHEMELVVAVGEPMFRVAADDATAGIYGYAAGLDMTKRDLQASLRRRAMPWDLSKVFEGAAPVGAITPAVGFPALGRQRISLEVNGGIRQDATLADLIWTVPEILSHLSRFYPLRPGDLVFTGTPGGVGPVVPGDTMIGRIEGLEPVTVSVGQPLGRGPS